MPEEQDQDARLIAWSVAQNNWTQAKSDLATAVTLMDAGIHYAGVFFSQQVARSPCGRPASSGCKRTRAATTSSRAQTICKRPWRS